MSCVVCVSCCACLVCVCVSVWRMDGRKAERNALLLMLFPKVIASFFKVFDVGRVLVVA